MFYTPLPQLRARFAKAIASRPKWEIRIYCLILALIIAGSERFVHARISLTALYAIPLSILAWFVDVPSAIILSLLSVLFWVVLVVPTSPNGPFPAILFGIVLLRLIYFGFVSILVGRTNLLQNRLESLAEIRARALASETAERQRLEQEMLEISEREQRRIGQDLHDGLCQLLTGAALKGNTNARRLSAIGLHDEARDVLNNVAIIEEAISLARSIANGLDPLEMQGHGLMGALDKFAATASDLFGIECRFGCQSPVLVDRNASIHLFRIAQEAVGNAVKHGKATIVDVSLEETDQWVRLSIVDNGAGLSGESTKDSGRGVRTMTVRAKLVGGTLSMRPSKFGGVEVSCLIAEPAYA
jgi:signal transduction histidine kinase